MLPSLCWLPLLTQVVGSFFRRSDCWLGGCACVGGVSRVGAGGFHAVGRRLHWPRSASLVPSSFAVFCCGFLVSVCAGIHVTSVLLKVTRGPGVGGCVVRQRFCRL